MAMHPQSQGPTALDSWSKGSSLGMEVPGHGSSAICMASQNEWYTHGSVPISTSHCLLAVPMATTSFPVHAIQFIPISVLSSSLPHLIKNQQKREFRIHTYIRLFFFFLGRAMIWSCRWWEMSGVLQCSCYFSLLLEQPILQLRVFSSFLLFCSENIYIVV